MKRVHLVRGVERLGLSRSSMLRIGLDHVPEEVARKVACYAASDQRGT